MRACLWLSIIHHRYWAVVLQSALNSLGTDVVAAQATAGRIDQFATQPMMSSVVRSLYLLNSLPI